MTVCPGGGADGVSAGRVGVGDIVGAGGVVIGMAVAVAVDDIEHRIQPQKFNNGRAFSWKFCIYFVSVCQLLSQVRVTIASRKDSATKPYNRTLEESGTTVAPCHINQLKFIPKHVDRSFPTISLVIDRSFSN